MSKSKSKLYGVLRLKGKDMEQLRRDVFERDDYRCQHVISADLNGVEMLCLIPVSWENGHLAHTISRARGGPDTAENCKTKCLYCHIVREHIEGGKGKIVPAKS